MTLPTAFASDKHPRGAHGRFAGIDNKAGPSFSNAPLVERGVPGRSPTRGERWQRTGALFAPAHGEIPISYTGKREKEHTTGTMLVHEFKPQIPAKMPVKDWMALTGKLTAVANEHMKPTLANVVENGIKVPTHKFSGPKHKTWKPPPGTHRQSLVRAYIHGTKLALHDYGVAKYDFAMDDHLKAEMEPLKPFIRHVVKKLVNEMNVATPGQQWRPFRQEFGTPFPTPKYDKQIGEERKRMRVNQELVKRKPGDPLTSNELEERRAAARSRWESHGATKVDLARGLRPSLPKRGAETSPKEAVRMMRQWGRTNRTERAVYLTPKMDHVIGRDIGDTASVDVGKKSQRALKAHGGGYTVIHNHPSATPLSAPDLQTMTVEAGPRRVMAADPKGAVSVVTRKVSAKELAPHAERLSDVVSLMIERRSTRKMLASGAGKHESPLPALKEEASTHFAAHMHGALKDLHTKGIVDYKSTGDYSPAATRAGQRMAHLAARATANDIARWTFNNKKGTSREYHAPKKSFLSRIIGTGTRLAEGSPEEFAHYLRMGRLYKAAPPPPKAPQTREERKRMRVNQELVKRFPAVTILHKAAPPAPQVPKPGVLAANPMLSRFARYRAEVAHDESMGVHDMKMLTPAQKLQRLHAGIALRRKIQSGAPKLLPGQPGSVAGLHIKRPASPNAPVAPAGAKAR